MEKSSDENIEVSRAGGRADSHVPGDFVAPEIDDTTRDLTVAEHQLGFWAAVRMYPKATFWAMFFCIAVVMAGFDGQIITSFYALPAFQQQYGDRIVKPDGTIKYEVAAAWQTGLGMGNPIGQVVGALACSYPLQYFGRRVTLAMCCVWSIGFIFMQFFATSTAMLCAGEVVGGLAYGFYVVIAPTYASEVCPVVLRGFLTASVNLAFVIGQFIAQGCAAGVESRLDQWAYKAPFAVQWVWPVVLLAGLGFAPESPYWLVRCGRMDDARKSLQKLTSAKYNPDIEKILLGIQQTDRLEREYEDTTSYWDCFKGSNLIRTEISVMVYLIQVISGNPLIGYANYFFEQAGLPNDKAFDMGVGNTALGFVGTILSWPLMNYFHLGRRTIYSGGLGIMTVLLFIIGFLAIPQHNTAAVWALSTLMDVWTFVYQSSVGPICFVVISEISATRLREKTIAISTAVQSAANVVTMVVIPILLNSEKANWGGKTGFLFGGISFFCFVWCFFRLPESQGRTYEELDILFQRRVPARKFAKYDLIAEADEKQPA